MRWGSWDIRLGCVNSTWLALCSTILAGSVSFKNAKERNANLQGVSLDIGGSKVAGRQIELYGCQSHEAVWLMKSPSS